MSFDLRTQLPLLPSARKNNATAVAQFTTQDRDEIVSVPEKTVLNQNDESSSRIIRSQNDLILEADDESDDESSLKIRNKHLEKLSAFSPLPASTTAALTLNFLSTSVSFINTFAAAADDKLERCSKRIRDLEIQMSLLESKLDSSYETNILKNSQKVIYSSDKKPKKEV